MADNQINDQDEKYEQEGTPHENVVEDDHEQDFAAQEVHEAQTSESQAKANAAIRI